MIRLAASTASSTSRQVACSKISAEYGTFFIQFRGQGPSINTTKLPTGDARHLGSLRNGGDAVSEHALMTEL
jgi:hypothetical protein